MWRASRDREVSGKNLASRLEAPCRGFKQPALSVVLETVKRRDYDKIKNVNLKDTAQHPDEELSIWVSAGIVRRTRFCSMAQLPNQTPDRTHARSH
jgi:hypothetical protein